MFFDGKSRTATSSKWMAIGISSSTSVRPFGVRLIATVRPLSFSRARVTRPRRFISPTSRDNVDISIDDDVLSIKGEFQSENESEEDTYHRRELRYGSFHRSLRLPVSVDSEYAMYAPIM